MKKLKAALSIMLTLIMLLGVVPLVETPVSATPAENNPSSGYDMTIDFGYKDKYSTPEDAMKGEINEGFEIKGSGSSTSDWITISEDVMGWQKNSDAFRKALEHTDSAVKYVVLQSDQTETMKKKVWEPIEISQDVVLDLNGYEIKLSDDYNADGSKQRKEIFAHSSTMFEIINGATLTIIDSSMKNSSDGKGTGSIYANGRMIDPYKYYYKNYTHRDIFHVDSGNLVVYGGQFQAGRTKVQKKKNFSWDKLKTAIGQAVSLGVSIFEYSSGIGEAKAALDDVQASFDKALDSVKEGEADVENALSAAKGAKDLTTEKQKTGDDDKVAKEQKQNKPTDDKKASSEKVDEDKGDGRNETIDEKSARRNDENEKDGKNKDGENKADKDKASKDDKNSKIYAAKKAVIGAALDQNKITDMTNKAFDFAEGVAGLFGSKGAIMETVWGTPVKVGTEGTFVSYGGTYIGYGSDQLLRNATIEVSRPKNSKKGGKAYIYDGTFEGKAGANVFNIVREARALRGTTVVTDDVKKIGSIGYYTDENGARRQMAFTFGNGNNDGRGADDEYINYVEGTFEDDPDTSCIQVRGGTFRNYFEHYNVGIYSVASGKDDEGNDIRFTPYAGTTGSVNLGVASYNENFIRDGRIQIIDTYGDGALVLMDVQDKGNENVYHYRLYCGDTELRYKRYLKVYPTTAESSASHSFRLTTQYRNQNTMQTGTALEGLVKTDENGNVVTEVLRNEDPLDDVEDTGAYSQSETFFYYPLGINNSHNYYVVPDLNDGTDVRGSNLDASSAWYYNVPTDYNGHQINSFKYIDDVIYGKSNHDILFTKRDDGNDYTEFRNKIVKGEMNNDSWTYGQNSYNYLTNFKWFKYRVYRVDPLTRENISESNVYGEDVPLKEAVYGTSTNSLRCKLPLDELGIKYKPGEIYRIVFNADEYLGYNYENRNSKLKGLRTNLKTATVETSMLFMCYDGNEEITDKGHSYFEEDYTPLQWVSEPEAGKTAKVQLVNGKTGQCDCNGDNIFDVYYQWYQVENDGTEKMIAGTDNIFTGDILSNGTVRKSTYATKQYHTMIDFKAKGTYYNGQYINDKDADGYTYLNSVDPDDPNKDNYMENGLPRSRAEWTEDMLHMYTHEDRVKSEYTKDGSSRIYLANNKYFAHNTDSCYIPESAKGKKVYCKVICVNTYWQKNYPHVQVYRTHTLNTVDDITAKINVDTGNTRNFLAKKAKAAISVSGLKGLKKNEYINSLQFGLDNMYSDDTLYNNVRVYSDDDLAKYKLTFPDDFLYGDTLEEFCDSNADGRKMDISLSVKTNLGRKFTFYSDEFVYGLDNQFGDIGWTLKDGTLTLSGDSDGVMPDYSDASDYPWYFYKNKIKDIVFDISVANIGDHAFEGYTNLKTVTFNNYPVSKISRIGEFAFSDSGLNDTVNLPFNDITLGEGAFYRCESLREFDGGRIAVIPDSAFYACDKLEKVSASSVKKIGNEAFLDCPVLKTASLGSSVEEIGNNAFTSTAITSFDFSSVKTVGKSAFYDVPLRVVAGDKFESIGDMAFAYFYNEKFHDVDVDTTTLFISSNANPALADYAGAMDFNIDQKLGECWFDYDIQTSTITVFADVRAESSSTGDYGSYLASAAGQTENVTPWKGAEKYIKNIVIEDGVTEIGESTFAGVQAKEIKLPDSVTKVGYGAFSWNMALQSIDLNKVERLDTAVFALSGIKSLTVPKSCNYIGNMAFGLSNLNEITILNPDCVIYDSNHVFPTKCKLKAYEDSTARNYAETYAEEGSYTFEAISPNPELSVTGVTTRRGGEVTVDVNISNNPGIAAFAFNIDYPEGLTLTGVETNKLFSSKATGAKNLASPYRLQWYSTESENEIANGTIATLTFKVDAKAALKKYPIKISYTAEDIVDSDMNNVEFATDNGFVYVKNLKSGDVNNDGNVNMKDIVLLQKYLNGYDVTINTSASDVNADGKINMKDIALLQQYLNGWEVVLK